MTLKEIFKNTIWYGLAPKLATLIMVIITPVITPYMTPHDYGVIGIVSAYVTTLAGFTTLGLHVHLTNSYYEYQHQFPSVWRRLIFWMVIGSLLFAFIAIIVLWIELPSVYPWNRFVVILLSCIGVMFSFNEVVAQHYYNLRLSPMPLVLRNLFASLLGLGVMFFVVYYLRWGYMGYIISTAISSTVLFILFLKPLWIDLRLYPLPNRINSRAIKWFKVALPIIPHNVGHVLLNSSDRIIMSILLVSTYDIGIYSNGYTFGAYGGVLIIALSTSLTPVVQTSYRTGNYKQLRKILIFSEAFSLSLIAIMSIWMKEIYYLLVRNEELQSCYSIAGYTCFSFAMFPLYSVLCTPAFVEKKTVKLLWLIFVPALLNIILNLAFIPIYGYKAAIITTIVSYWSILLIAIIVPYYKAFLKKCFGSYYNILWLLLSCVVVLLFASILSEFDLILKIFTTSLLLIIVAIGIFVKREQVFSFSLQHTDFLDSKVS